MRVVKIAGVVLAAGFSRRLGRPKQDIVLAGSTLLERAILTAKEAGLNPLAVVLREGYSSNAHNFANTQVLLNADASEGMASSVRVATRWALDIGADGLVLMTCDQPQLRSQHLNALCADPDRVTGSAYAGRIGVPAYFPLSAFQALLRVEGDRGARDLLQAANSVVNEDLNLDIDTEDDLRRAEKLLGAGS